MKYVSGRGRGRGGARAGIWTVARVIGAAGALALAASESEAAITKLIVTRIESPTFGGTSFPGVGQYEKITARAYGEVDSSAPGNALITDINGAPRNANGHVEYAT